MASDKKYEEILKDVVGKINEIEPIKEIDILDMKNSIENIENSLSDSQSKINFQEIKEKLEKIAFQVDNCNDAILKDINDDLSELKKNSKEVSQHIENLQNVQNLALTSAEFEEYQKQQLDLALKSNENIFNEINALKENSQGVDYSANIKNLETQLGNIHTALTNYIEQIAVKVGKIPNIDEIGSVVSDLNGLNQKDIKQTNTLIKAFQTKFTDFQSEFKYKDIENQVAKISEIYDSLNIIQAWIKEVGFLNRSIDNVYARLGETIDFDDVAEKVDIIYESIGVLNSWAQKLDNIDGSMFNAQSKIAALSDCLEDAQNINKVISALKEKFDSTFSDELDFEDISNKMDIIYENLNSFNEWVNKIDTMSDKVSNMSGVFEEEMISSKIDLIYENISLLNDWVNKINTLSQHTEHIETKVDEVNKTLENANKLVEDVPDIKDKLEQLSGELNTIIHSTKDDTDSYIYTLLDIESDFLKLHKFLDDKTQSTSQIINDLKSRFDELNDDISSISVRTNKLILSADDANKEFKTYLEEFKSVIKSFEEQRQRINPELQFALIEDKVDKLGKALASSTEANKNVNNALLYLAEWIDATGSLLNTMSAKVNNIENSVKIIQEKQIENDKRKEDEKPEITAEDVSEIKTFLTGIMVQLNTALTPDIDSINNRVDNVSEENEKNFMKIEDMLQEKVNQQAKHIASLEQRIDSLNSKFDKLIDAMSDNNTNLEIKDVLNYIAAQMTATKEAVATQQGSNAAIEEMNEKLNNFGNNIDKLVSYIEEE